MQVLLLSTYELGRQPFGLASPAAWLEEAGCRVRLQDLSRQKLNPAWVQTADLIGIYLPMHTATRLAVRLIPRLQKLNPEARLCCYGLYARLNRELLERLGADSILGGEFEEALVQLALGNGAEPVLDQELPRLRFRIPNRDQLPPLTEYARVREDAARLKTVGYTEATRGCLHLCRHCPVVPIYEGRLRIVQKEVVLADIESQVANGAEHITFGDPDFFNAPGHALAIVKEMNERHPALTYDATIKIEHLLKYHRHLPDLRRTGCLWITSAVESTDDRVLALLAKGHTRRDFYLAAGLLKEADLILNPTLVPFTPWTTIAGYRELLRCLADLELVEQTAPIQLGIRLLITSASGLLQLPDIRKIAAEFDPDVLAYPWQHPDPRVDALAGRILGIIEETAKAEAPRTDTFRRIWDAAYDGHDSTPLLPARSTIPYLTEPWYC